MATTFTNHDSHASAFHAPPAGHRVGCYIAVKSLTSKKRWKGRKQRHCIMPMELLSKWQKLLWPASLWALYYRDGDSKSECCRFDSPCDCPLKEYTAGTTKIATLGNGNWIGYRENSNAKEGAASYVLGHHAGVPVPLANSSAEVLFHGCKTNDSLRKSRLASQSQ